MSGSESTSQPSTEVAPHGLARLTPVLLVRAAHPRQALLTAAALALGAVLSGRPPREVGLVAVTVLVGQALLGWDNDLVDEAADRADERTWKPLVGGGLDRGTLAFWLACAVLLAVPLALSSGIDAGLAYLLSVAVAALGNRWLRRGRLSWLPWALSFGLYPAYLSYGGWGGGADGNPPTVAVTVATAFLGVGVHVLVALRGLVEDNRAGRRHLPLRLALRLGAPRLLFVAGVYCALVIGALGLIGATVGLSQ
jgi:4-hydroxybenzoate polyprenyltransferase